MHRESEKRYSRQPSFPLRLRTLLIHGRCGYVRPLPRPRGLERSLVPGFVVRYLCQEASVPPLCGAGAQELGQKVFGGPFGLGRDEFQSWMFAGGGLDLYNEMLQKELKLQYCLLIAQCLLYCQHRPMLLQVQMILKLLQKRELYRSLISFPPCQLKL